MLPAQPSPLPGLKEMLTYGEPNARAGWRAGPPGSRWGAPMRKLSHAATVALELANRYRLAAITYRAIGALVLASACETMAETEVRMATAEIELSLIHI